MRFPSHSLGVRVLALLSIAAGFVVLSVPSAFSAAPDRQEAWPERIAVVGYDSPGALERALELVPGSVIRRIPVLGVAEIRPCSDPADFARAVAGLDGIEFVQRIERRVHRAEPALAPLAAQGTALEWQYAATGANAVPPNVLRAAAAIKIAVVDTGADVTAPDIGAKSPETHSLLGGGKNVRDPNGHGTFVASLAAGSVTNGEGIAGFGGDARLMVVRAGDDDGMFTDVDEAAGIVYAVDHGAKVINLSLGGTQSSETEAKAVDYAAASGALLVAAAGNEYADGNPIEYPAALLQPPGSNGRGGKGLAVGASTESGGRASFSNTGSHISLAAPGENVFAAVSSASRPSFYPRSPLPGSKAGLYGYSSGTSFSAPQVAGAAALVWAADPSLSASGVSEILKRTASGHGSWNPGLGHGVVNVGDAVATALARSGGIVVARKATAQLRLRVAPRPNRKPGAARVSALLRSPVHSVPSALRVVTLERFADGGWHGFARARTNGTGRVAWSVWLQAGTHRLRARYVGATDLHGGLSTAVRVKVGANRRRSPSPLPHDHH